MTFSQVRCNFSLRSSQLTIHVIIRNCLNVSFAAVGYQCIYLPCPFARHSERERCITCFRRLVSNFTFKQPLTEYDIVDLKRKKS